MAKSGDGNSFVLDRDEETQALIVGDESSSSSHNSRNGGDDISSSSFSTSTAYKILGAAFVSVSCVALVLYNNNGHSSPHMRFSIANQMSHLLVGGEPMEESPLLSESTYIKNGFTVSLKKNGVAGLNKISTLAGTSVDCNKDPLSRLEFKEKGCNSTETFISQLIILSHSRIPNSY